MMRAAPPLSLPYCLLTTVYCLLLFRLLGAALVRGVGGARGDGRVGRPGRAALVAVRDGATAADADGVARDDERRRELAPLELVGRRLDAVEDVVDERALVPLGVDLVGRQLGRRAFVDDGGGDQLAPAVDVAREVVDFGFEHVADDGEPAVRV